jgi:hypothetical protein
MDFNVHDTVDFDDSEMPTDNPFDGDDNEFLSKLGLERSDTGATVAVCQF